MFDQSLRLLTLSALLLLTPLLTAQTYNGNGNAGFGGRVGNGTLSFTSDGTNLAGTFTTGDAMNSPLGNVVVLYFDTQPGGFTSTSGMQDDADGLRRAISGFNAAENANTEISFPAGFEPDFAIAFDNDGFAGIWQLADGGSGSLNFVASADLGGFNSGVYTFDADYSELGISNTTTEISFVGTLISNTAFRSDEAFGPTTGTDSGNPGFNGNIAFTSALTLPIMALPVTLLDISAAPSGKAIDLDWRTATESANEGFTIERSADGERWAQIGFVGGAGDSNAEIDYRFTDSAPLRGGMNYYRLRQQDFNGSMSYSPVVSVAFSGTDAINSLELIGAVPVSSKLTLRNSAEVTQTVDLFDLNGRKLRSLSVPAGATVNEDTGALALGTYLLRARSGNFVRLIVLN